MTPRKAVARSAARETRPLLVAVLIAAAYVLGSLDTVCLTDFFTVGH